MTRRQKRSFSDFPASFSYGKLAWIFFIIVVLFLLTYLVFNPDNGYLQVNELRQERDQLLQDVEDLKEANQELNIRLRKIEQADSLIIESEARQKGMIREGEEVYRIRYIEQSDSSANH